mmetsp:Transcript_5872/g.7088  ORF Transcript_5872/g.7088 Transcript_5872/m.7088 type:complete len:138 (-) Transcript_5872:385-798(-)
MSRQTLQTEVDEQQKLHKRPPDIDPKKVTRQMLLNCHVFRKRNTNVTPLASNRSKYSHQMRSPRRTQLFTGINTNRRMPAQVIDGSQQSLDEYLDNMSFEKPRTGVDGRECEVRIIHEEVMHSAVRTAANVPRPSVL